MKEANTIRGRETSKTKLLFDLIMYINKKKIFTAQDIAYEFHVSVRTAHRYLMEVSELGIPLYTAQGRHGGYRTLPIRSLPPITFDEEEAFAIFFAFQALTYYTSLPFNINIASVEQKLYATLPDDTKEKISRLETVLTFWNQKKSPPTPFLKELLQAALTDTVLLITYRSTSKDTTREIKPIGVYTQNGLWYVLALLLEQDEVRLFRIDRILSVDNTTKTHPSPLSLSAWLNHHPITSPIHLYVTLTREGIRQCQSEPWLAPHIVATDHDHGYISMDIDTKEIPFASHFFFQLGTNAQVIEPNEIRSAIREQAQKLLNNYQ